jgi:2-hydroxychromene-2-carboxylate isomerase
MAKQKIDFWFSIGSIYTYLSVMRLPDVAAATAIEFRWRPFSIRTLMIEMDNRPMKVPVKLAYMWHDMARRATTYGLPYRDRPPYPLKNLDLTNRIALVGCDEGWCPDYVRAAYLRWFTSHEEPGSEGADVATLHAIGQEPQGVLARAKSDEIVRRYEAATEEARKLGIFGVPTFAVADEIFWGDDRLDDAIAWHRSQI